MPSTRPRPIHVLVPLALALLLAAGVAPLVAAAPAGAAPVTASAPRPPVAVVGRTHRLGVPRRALGADTGPLVDHGGAILPVAHVHPVWWGRPSGFAADEHEAVASFLAGLDGSRHLALLTPYLRGAAPHVVPADELTDTSTPPRTVTPAVLGAEVARLTGGRVDPLGVYLVLTANAPTGATFCGWHDAVSIAGTTVAVSYIPAFGERSPCDAGDRVGANGASARTRTTINVVAHELFEAMTDAVPGPRTGAWIDAAGLEIGDKCAWRFVAPVQLRNGTRWQLQTEWSNATGRCEQGA